MAIPENVESALKRPDRRSALMALLGDSVPIERFEQIVIQNIYRNPDLQRASLASLLDAVRVAATSKLEPTGVLGEGYLIRYGEAAQFEFGYRGLMKLARRSGQVSGIDSQIVYDNDEFDVDLGSEPRITHRPTLDTGRGNYRGAYAYARLATGELIVDWMSYADIEAVRKISRNGQGDRSPWVNHWGEMARKTVLKRLMKRLPLGADAEGALVEEARADEAARPVRPSAGIARIHDRLGITSQGEPQKAEEPPSGHGADSAQAVTGDGEPPPDEGAAANAPAAAPDVDATAIAETVFEGEFIEVKDEAVQAFCTAIPPVNAMGFTEQCTKAAGHRGAHESSEGTFPNETREESK
jgi:recombination protein RecT